MRVRTLICGVLLALPGLAYGWGSDGHEIIVRNAIELLPAEIKPFYLANLRFINALVILPDSWRRTHKAELEMDHGINLDSLASPPFDAIPLDREEAEKKFGKDKIAQAGVLPWAVQERWKKLVSAFRMRNTEEIVVHSALLAHFVGDAHVPLHTTKDYDGRTPEQRGIHFRFEENLVKLWLRPESIKPRSPERIEDVTKSAFKWCIDSYNCLDAVLKADDKARRIEPALGYGYFKVLFENTESILIDRLTRASEAAAGVIISAWICAGSPVLPGEPAPMYWGM